MEKFGRCSRSRHYYFCIQLGFFILSAEISFLLIQSSCLQSGCSLLWISRRGVVPRNDNHHSDSTPLCQPSSCSPCRPLCNNTPPLPHTSGGSRHGVTCDFRGTTYIKHKCDIPPTHHRFGSTKDGTHINIFLFHSFSVNLHVIYHYQCWGSYF